MTDLSHFDPNGASNPKNNIFGLPFPEADARLVRRELLLVARCLPHRLRVAVDRVRRGLRVVRRFLDVVDLDLRGRDRARRKVLRRAGVLRAKRRRRSAARRRPTSGQPIRVRGAGGSCARRVSRRFRATRRSSRRAPTVREPESRAPCGADRYRCRSREEPPVERRASNVESSSGCAGLQPVS